MTINRSELDHDPASTLTLTDELARALRNLMAMNGEPAIGRGVGVSISQRSSPVTSS